MNLKLLFISAFITLACALSPSVWAASYTLQADSNPLNTGNISLWLQASGNAEHQNGDIVQNPGQTELFSNVVDLRGSVHGIVPNGAGTFTVDENIWDSWDSIFIGLKQGNSFAIFELTNSIVSGTWSTTCGKNPCTGLSHFLAFGGEPLTTVQTPIPAAVWLFGSALAGLGFTKRKTVKA